MPKAKPRIYGVCSEYPSRLPAMRMAQFQVTRRADAHGLRIRDFAARNNMARVL